MFFYLSFVAVNPEKLEQGMHALLVMEELGGEVTVEELHAVTDRLGKSRAREGGREGLKVQLEHKVAIDTAKNKQGRSLYHKTFITLKHKKNLKDQAIKKRDF